MSSLIELHKEYIESVANARRNVAAFRDSKIPELKISADTLERKADNDQLIADALRLQIPAAGIPYPGEKNTYYCPECNAILRYHHLWCWNCGQRSTNCLPPDRV